MTQHRTEQRAEECICGGAGLVTRLTEGGGNTGPRVCPDCYVPRAPLLTALSEHLGELRERGLTAVGEAQADREESDYFYGIRDALGEADALLRSKLESAGLNLDSPDTEGADQ